MLTTPVWDCLKPAEEQEVEEISLATSLLPPTGQVPQMCRDCKASPACDCQPEMCPACLRTVAPTDKVHLAEDKVFHEGCFQLCRMFNITHKDGANCKCTAPQIQDANSRGV